jgi:maleate isomerase
MVGSAPVLSCMLCVAWRAVAFRDPAADTRSALLDWVHGAHWRSRLEQRQDIRA